MFYTLQGEQFSINGTTLFNNTFCRNPANNVPPTLLFQVRIPSKSHCTLVLKAAFKPHSVPLDIKFYATPRTSTVSKGLPSKWSGDAFVSFHGSFDRVPPTGYGVVRYISEFHCDFAPTLTAWSSCSVPWAKDGSAPLATPHTKLGYEFLVQAANLTACTVAGACIRPVGLSFEPSKGRLFVSSDTTGEVSLLD